eukprot:1146914-Pelagomonas_calceolata.AAC.9
MCTELSVLSHFFGLLDVSEDWCTFAHTHAHELLQEACHKFIQAHPLRHTRAFEHPSRHPHALVQTCTDALLRGMLTGPKRQEVLLERLRDFAEMALSSEEAKGAPGASLAALIHKLQVGQGMCGELVCKVRGE